MLRVLFLFFISYSLFAQDGSVVLSPEDLNGTLADYYHGHIESMREKQRMVDVDEDWQTYDVFREREFVYDDYVRVIATTENRYGWPFIAEVILRVAQENGMDEIKDIFDPKLTQIWRHPDGLETFKARNGELADLVSEKLKQLRTNGRNTHIHRVKEWAQFVIDDYAKREGWSEELLETLEKSLVTDRMRSDWGVSYARNLSPGKVGNVKGSIVGTIMKTRSRYMRFLIQEQTSKPNSNAFKEYICKSSACNPLNALKPRIGGGSYYGIEESAPDSLVVEDVFKISLPRMSHDQNEKTETVELGGSKFTIVSKGLGEISEDRCFVIRKGIPNRAKVYAETFVALQFLMMNAFSPHESLRYQRSYAYVPRDRKGQDKTRQIYKQLGAFDEVYDPQDIVWGDGSRETMQLFSWGPSTIAELIRNPEKFRSLAGVDSNFLLDSLKRHVFMESNREQSFEKKHVFWTIKRLGKYLHLLKDINLLDSQKVMLDHDAVTNEITDFLRSFQEVRELAPNVTAASFLLDVVRRHRFLKKDGMRYLYREVLKYHDIEWTEVVSTAPLTLIEVQAALLNMSVNYPFTDTKATEQGISLNQSVLRNSSSVDHVMKAIFEATGKRKTPVVFVDEIVSLGKKLKIGNYYDVLATVPGLNANHYQSEMAFSQEEVDAVVLGFIARTGKIGTTEFKDKSKRELYDSMIADMLPDRPVEFCTLGRFQKAVQKIYKNFGNARKKLGGKVAKAEKTFASSSTQSFPTRAKLKTKSQIFAKKSDALLTKDGLRRLERVVNDLVHESAENLNIQQSILSIGSICVREKLNPFSVINDERLLENVSLHSIALGRSPISFGEARSILIQLNERFLKPGTIGRIKVYTQGLFRRVLKELHDKRILKPGTAFKKSKAIKMHLKNLPGYESKELSSISFYNSVLEFYKPYAQELGMLRSNDIFKAALDDAEIDWRPYYPKRQLDPWELVKIYRKLVIVNGEESDLTPSGLKEIPEEEFKKIVWDVAQADKTASEIVKDSIRSFGSWYKMVYMAGFDPNKWGAKSKFNPNRKTKYLRSIIDAALKETSASQNEIIPPITEYLMTHNIHPNVALNDKNAFNELLNNIHGSDSVEGFDVLQTKEHLAAMAHRIDMDARWGRGAKCRDVFK